MSISDGDHQAPPKATSGIPFITISAINDGRLNLDRATRFVPPAYYQELNPVRRARAGDVLYSVTGSIGIPALVEGDEPFVFQRHIALLRPAPDVCEPRWLAYMLASPAMFEQARGIATGTAQLTIPLSGLRKLRLPAVSLAEQHRIVAKLDALAVHLARARAELERVPALAQKLRHEVVDAGFTGHLTSDWRDERQGTTPPSDDDLEKDRLSIDGAEPRRKPPAAIDWRPDITLPEAWRWVSVDQLAAVVQYGSSAKTGALAEGVPVLRMGNIQDGRLDWSNLKYLLADHAEFPDLLLRPGDILFNRTNSLELVGKSAAFEGDDRVASFASYLIRVRVGGILPRLLVYYLNSPFGRAWVQRSSSQQVGQANVNGSKLKALGVPLASKEEQAELLARIDAAFARADRLKAEAARARDLLDRLEAALLGKAFRGELVPQDPSDEPASFLLERIRAERATNAKAKRGRRPLPSIDEAA